MNDLKDKLINESIANINYHVNDTNQRVNDAMIALEYKEILMEDFNGEETIVERWDINPFENDVDIFVEAFADYDFTGHKAEQGERNLNFATAVCRIIEASDDYHKKNLGTERSGIQISGKANNNTVKYEKLGQLVKQFASLRPNFAKLTVVSDDIGRDPHNTPSIVVFIEMHIDDKEYWISWHVMDPSNTKRAKYKQPGTKFKSRMDSYDTLKSYNHPSFIKLVKNNKTDDTEKYLEMERKYKNVPYDRKGDATHTMLMEKFNLGKKNKK